MNTAALIQRVQEAGVELRLEDGKLKYSGKSSAMAGLMGLLQQHKGDLIRWFQHAPAYGPEPPEDPSVWRELAQAYHAHHFSCKTCCAAGQGRGLRCGTGTALFSAYQTLI